ncbi:hypothetical protein D9758_002265 [Tetrapyrgos nigripes]|uniref:Pentatricopeptide repeat-containing protein n=1 Tax=Tetrapyrgos nigripes TaxID=182062 RepID=A0A8H5GPD0_9AGAR|nr:hypothetical protein D9758_002265 [Tetrapyrgos nigripes]
MSLRAALFRLGRTLPRNHYRHPHLLTRLPAPLTRFIVLTGHNEVGHSKLQNCRGELKKSPGQLEVIHRYYPALVWQISQARSLNPEDSPSTSQEIYGIRVQDILSREKFEVMLDALATSGRPIDLQLIDDILTGMADVFQVPPDSQTHSIIIRRLIQRKNMQTIHRWLQNMPKKPGGVIPTLEHYHMFLEACPEFASIKFMRNLVQSMWKAGFVPNTETYKIFVRGAWKMTENKSPAALVIPILHDMRDAGTPHDPDFLQFLESLYSTAGLDRYALDVVVAYNSVYEYAVGPEQVLENQWISRLSDGSQNFKTRLQTYGDYVQQGGSPSSNIFSALLRGCYTVSNMEMIADTLGMDPTTQNWNTLITNNVKAGQLENALVIYQQALAAGVQPEASVVGPILKGIFNSDKAPSEALADHGLDVYTEFCSNALPETSPLDLEIHQMMLKALSKLQDTNLTEIIMKELKARDVPISSMVTSMILTEMNQASAYQGALEVYKAYRFGLDAQGYEQVLEGFCLFCLQQNFHVPPLTIYFSIVKDMKTAGFPATSSVYIIILRLLGRAGTLSHRRVEYRVLSGKLVAATKRVHDLITLESSFFPDTRLWNQLLDTYSRLDCHADVLRLWDQMYTWRRYDNDTVSTVFQTCRRFGSLRFTRETYERLRKRNFRFSLDNWNSYIAALCTVGDLNTALKALCVEMTANGVKPEVRTANIILHQESLKGTALRSQMFSRIQKHQPELYEELKAQARPNTEDGGDLESS